MEEKSELTNVHDKYFKLTFGSKDNIKDFLEEILPPRELDRIDLDTLETMEDTYIGKDFDEHRTDVIFRVNGKYSEKKAYVCCLFEHKSTQEKLTVLQVLTYMTKIWNKKVNDTGKIPYIIPIIFYHGDSEWSAPKKMSELVDFDSKVSSSPHFPELEPILIQMQELERKLERFDILTVRLYLRAVNIYRAAKGYERTGDMAAYWRRFDEYTNTLGEYRNMLSEEEKSKPLMADEILAASYLYVLHCTPKEYVDKVISAFKEKFPEGSENFMHVKDSFYTKAKEEGEEKVRQSMLKTLEKLLAEELGSSLSDVLTQRLNECSYDKLNEVLLNIRNISSESDVFQILD